MTFPNLADTHRESALLTAADLLAQRRRAGNLTLVPPVSVIICYQASLAQYVTRHYAVKKVRGLMGDLFLLNSTRGRVAVAANFGIGAPAVAVLMEDLAAWGVQRFLAVGLAGGLQPDGQSGDVVVCDRALRDEGTSHHYAAHARFAPASPEMVEHLTRVLSDSGIPHTVGGSWTTDAPYRETLSEVIAYQQEGLKAVEMEAAALFVVGQYLNRQVGAAVVVGDTLADLRWQLGGDEHRIQRNLRALLDAAISALKE